MITRAFDRLYSRYSRAPGLHTCDIHAHRVNPWCSTPIDLFGEFVKLHPNPIGAMPPIVGYTLYDVPTAVDSLSFHAYAANEKSRGVRLISRILDHQGNVLAVRDDSLYPGKPQAISLEFKPGTAPLTVEFSVENLVGAASHRFGGIIISQMVAYESNELVRLTHKYRTDKGCEKFLNWNPHCYAVAYDDLLAPLRGDSFRMLEIGLDTPSRAKYNSPHTLKEEDGGRSPKDAPSLRVWREYFPDATIYGFDINDFGFFEQRDTHVFQGDQSSRESLEHFLSEAGSPSFRFILDDGSHASSHQQITLAKLYPHLESGGIYIIEDLRWQPFEEDVPTTQQLFEDFQSLRTLDTPAMTNTEREYIREHTSETLLIQPNDGAFLVLRKK